MSTLNPTQRCLLDLIEDTIRRFGQCFLCQDTMARKLGLSRHTVMRHLSVLEDLSRITRTRRHTEDGHRSSDLIEVGSLSSKLRQEYNTYKNTLVYKVSVETTSATPSSADASALSADASAQTDDHHSFGKIEKKKIKLGGSPFAPPPGSMASRFFLSPLERIAHTWFSNPKKALAMNVEQMILEAKKKMAAPVEGKKTPAKVWVKAVARWRDAEGYAQMQKPLTAKEVGQLNQAAKKIGYERLMAMIEKCVSKWPSFASHAQNAQGWSKNPSQPHVGFFVTCLDAAHTFGQTTKQSKEAQALFEASKAKAQEVAQAKKMAAEAAIPKGDELEALRDAELAEFIKMCDATDTHPSKRKDVFLKRAQKGKLKHFTLEQACGHVQALADDLVPLAGASQ